MGSTFFQAAKDQVDYEDRALVYYYCLSLIFRDFNQAELDFLFSISLSYFYGKGTKDGKKTWRDVFESAYNQVKRELIINIIVEVNLWLDTLVGNNYYDKYYLV